MYRAKRNIIFEGKLYERGQEYELNENEVKNIGIDFDASVPKKEAPEKPKKEVKEEKSDTENNDEGQNEEADESENKGENPKKAKRK